MEEQEESGFPARMTKRSGMLLFGMRSVTARSGLGDGGGAWF